jgi:hypothetical protein
MSRTAGIATALCIVAITGVVASKLLAQPTRSTTVAGDQRFVLVAAKHVITTDSSFFTEDALFRVDSRTGKTWKYSEGRRNGEFFTEWREVADK